MKKFFWIAVIFLLVLTFSDHELIRPYKEQVYNLIMDKASNASDSNEAALRHVKKELMAAAENWGEGPRSQLEKATSSLDSVLRFHKNYCVNGDFNPIIYGEPLKQSCVILNNQHHNLTKP